MPTPQQKGNTRRYYFDKDYLLQYIDQKVKLKVYVDGRFLEIADSSDLEDDLHGVGYDNSGNPKFFDYRSITKVKAGADAITLDQLQQQQEVPAEPEDAKKEPAAGEEEEPAPEDTEPEPEEEPAPEEPEKGKTPQKAHYDPYEIGKNLIREGRKRSMDGRLVRIVSGQYANCSGLIISESKGGEYEVRLLSGTLGRVFVDEREIKFI